MREKLEVLAELRTALYCSQCQRLKSELERAGESFEEHVGKVQVRRAPAPEELIARKMAEFDQNIALLEQELDVGTCPAGMAWIPKGRFRMGARGDEVTVSGFCLDLTEVTVAEYSSHTTPKASERWEDGSTNKSLLCNGLRADRQNHPMNCVDWNQAAAHCAAELKRLPTEAEWEWAARGGAHGWM